MTPEHRTVLLEASYALEHLVWAYRSELDRNPTQGVNADEICLSDFATRTASLVRGVLDEDNKRSGRRLAFRPPFSSDGKRLAEAIVARRRALAAKQSADNQVPSELVADAPENSRELSVSADEADGADAQESCSSIRGYRRRPR
jgi:hypothetical protein